jgi:hypothetical protein
LKGLEVGTSSGSLEAEPTAIAASVERLNFRLPSIDPLLGSVHLNGVLSIALQLAGKPPITVSVGRLDDEVVMRGRRME